MAHYTPIQGLHMVGLDSRMHSLLFSNVLSFPSQVHVFVTHLSLSEAARERTVVEIWRFMSRFTGSAVLLGDLNAEPQSKCIRYETKLNQSQESTLSSLVLMYSWVKTSNCRFFLRDASVMTPQPVDSATRA